MIIFEINPPSSKLDNFKHPKSYFQLTFYHQGQKKKKLEMTNLILWHKLPISETELNLSIVLRCGQTFRWKNINNVWTFATKDRILLLKQGQQQQQQQREKDFIEYSHIMKSDKKGTYNDTLSWISDYFTLDTKLHDLYASWKVSGKKYSTTISKFDSHTGIRTLRQDPWECLISFICSSNNNVKRISKMCDNLCEHFGDLVNEYEGYKHYSFPTPEQLSASNTESKLRELGFGYRAKYIYQTAKKFTSPEYPDITIEKLMSMRDMDYEQAHEFLLQLSGVGPKVADCICLMSLDKHDVVPIDTHVYQIAVRDFKYKGKRDLKTLNKEMHRNIRKFFRDIFGDYAGWAQSVLFAADLNDFNNGTNVVSVELSQSKGLKREVDDDTDAVKNSVVTGTTTTTTTTSTSTTTANSRAVKKRRTTSVKIEA